MTHIENNYAPIILGDYVEHQENHIERSYSYINQAEFDVAPQDGNSPQKHGPQPLTLTERQQEAFDEALSREFMEKTPTGYKWKLSPTLLDYFLGRTFCDDYPDKGSEGFVVWSYGKGNKPLPVVQLRLLFGDDNIGNIRRQRQCKAAPKDRLVIDNLFGA